MGLPEVPGCFRFGEKVGGVGTNKCVSGVLLQEPIRLLAAREDNACHTIFQACLRDWRPLRQLGLRGICIERVVLASA